MYIFYSNKTNEVFTTNNPTKDLVLDVVPFTGSQINEYIGGNEGLIFIKGEKKVYEENAFGNQVLASITPDEEPELTEALKNDELNLGLLLNDEIKFVSNLYYRDDAYDLYKDYLWNDSSNLINESTIIHFYLSATSDGIMAKIKPKLINNKIIWDLV